MVLSLITMNSHSPFITINQPFLSPLTKVSVDPSDVGKIGNAPLALVTLSCRSDLNRWKWLGLKGRESNDCHGEVLGIPMRISRGKTKHTEVLHGLMLWCFSSTPVFLPWKMGAFLYRTRSLHPNSWRKKTLGAKHILQNWHIVNHNCWVQLVWCHRLGLGRDTTWAWGRSSASNPVHQWMYPLVNVYRKLGKITILNGYINYFYGHFK